jgi:putative flippase GtrA
MLPARVAEICRYLLTGAITVALNLLIIVLLTEGAGLNYLVSISVCFVTVTFVNFFLNRYWTFRKRGRGVPQDLGRFALVAAINLPLSLAACSFGVEVLKLPYVAAVALTSILFVPTTYLLHRGWSFGLRHRVAVPDGQRE